MRKILTILLIIPLCLGFSIPSYASEYVPFVEQEEMYTYMNMREDIYVMTTVYPQLSYEILGTTADDRDIFVLTLGNTNAEHKILVQASIHAREYMNSQIVMSQVAYYLSNWNNEYKDGITYKDIFENCCLIIFPMVNPDGVSISQFGLDGIKNEELREIARNYIIREHVSYWKGNANGVDLNRNFNCGWNNKEAMELLNEAPAYAYFNGFEPETEPEIKAIIEVIEENEFDAAVCYHSSGNQVFWHSTNEPLNSIIQDLAYLTGEVTTYEVCVGNPVLRGLDYQWLTKTCNIPTVLIETGGYAAPLPEYTYNTVWKQNKYVLSELGLYFYNKAEEKEGE